MVDPQSVEFPGVFDMFKIGVGPSSSHTLGPWRAASAFVEDLQSLGLLQQTVRIEVTLYGSLALTGKGHGTDIAVMMGLTGADPESVPLDQVARIPERVRSERVITLAGGVRQISFDPSRDVVFLGSERLPDHANGMVFRARSDDARLLHEVTAYSIGGGFILRNPELREAAGEIGPDMARPYHFKTGGELLSACRRANAGIAQVARENERALRTDSDIDAGLDRIWDVMRSSVHRGCRTSGMLPGGLDVRRRAPELAARLTGGPVSADEDAWYSNLAAQKRSFPWYLKMVGCFALAANEENAAFGRVVTAPTNGSAGVIPAVALYYRYLAEANDGPDVRTPADGSIRDFLMVAGVVGSIFKTGATISAAMGGCQAEIGVSSAMAAAALAEGLGGTPEQALMAAEIAMEHHLGLTCDPIAGLVQVPCIERNSMGAVKAITAAHIALESDAAAARVTLDDVVRTMWQTAQDMNARYKETSLGGLAVNVSVRVPEC